MSHYSEIDFLFNNITKDYINLQTSNRNNSANIFDESKYFVYKNKNNSGAGTTNIKKYIKDKVYKNEDKSINPYVQLVMDFDSVDGQPGAGLRIKAADLAYLRELGVYPINRMAILRRFPEGCFVPEDLNEMIREPISTIVGWIKPSDNFGKVEFHENWATTSKRFDQMISKMIETATGGLLPIIPVPDFAQGMLFQLYKNAGLLNSDSTNETTDEAYENFDPSTIKQPTSYTDVTNGKGPTTTNSWGLNNIPIGDPNVLQEGPFRDPAGQNITSTFEFILETTYEQKLLGDVDPGSAMLDILDNIYAMGTSNMKFYWGDNSAVMKKAREASSYKANNLNAWWDMISLTLESFWTVIADFFKDEFTKLEKNYNDTIDTNKSKEDANKPRTDKEQDLQNQIDIENTKKTPDQPKLKTLQTELAKLKKDDISTKEQSVTDAAKKKLADAANYLAPFLQSVLTSTVSIWRFELRGSIELMVGGKMSSTPWYLSLGNPYAPWLATNHIIVHSASVETSNEMGFNDQPQRLTATFNCKFSRALGKQELMRMFNNTYRRTYNSPPPGTEASNSTSVKNAKNSDNIQQNPPKPGIPVSNQKSGTGNTK